MPTMELVATDPPRVGPYRLLRRLGSGGMGVVYLGDTGAGGLVAVKCLPPGVPVEVRDRLHREAVYLSQVRHPRVAAFVAADTQADRPWIAMQYVAGPSLAQASVPLGPAQLRHLTEGLAEALTALHRQGLTHRDVKPGNVILTHDGPVLVDLGIALGGEFVALTAVGMVVGTPEWMAPEQLSGGGSTHAIDTWGWAAVAAFAATGRPPFGGGPMDALAHRIRYEQPDLRGAPDWLRGALLAGFAKDPRARPTMSRLASVDGVRAVGAEFARSGAERFTVAVPPPVASMVPQVPPTRQQFAPAPPLVMSPPRFAPPIALRPGAPRPAAARPSAAPIAPMAPPRTAQPAAPPPSLREAARARKAARRPRGRDERAAAPPVAPRKRRGLLSRLLRRVVFVAVFVVVTIVLASAAYSAIRAQLDHIGWLRALGDLGDQVGRLLRG